MTKFPLLWWAMLASCLTVIGLAFLLAGVHHDVAAWARHKRRQRRFRIDFYGPRP